MIACIFLTAQTAGAADFQLSSETGSYQAVTVPGENTASENLPFDPDQPQNTALQNFLNDNPLSQAVPEFEPLQAPGDLPFLETGGQVSIEAEHPFANIVRSSKTWTLETSQPNFSGTGYFSSLPDTGRSFDSDAPTKSPELQYQVNFQNTGTYYIWIRANAPNGNSDSLHVGLDGAFQEFSDRIWISNVTSAGIFGWSKNDMNGQRARITVGSAGVHTLNVWMREDGSILDKIFLTQDINFVPSGFGPDESPSEDGGAVDPPTVDALPAFTNDTPLVLAGTKPANTSVWINGTQVVPADESTSWLHLADLEAEQLYAFSVTVKDADGNESSAVQVSTTYDITAPTVVLTSPQTTANADYTLAWTADGQAKSRQETLTEGANLLTIIEQDAAGNEMNAQFTVIYEPAAPGGTPFEETGGLLVIEAEHPDQNIPRSSKSWAPGTSLPGFSGESYFAALPDTNRSFDDPAVSPELQYNIFINNPGTYYVWVRGQAPDGKGDSLHVGLDGQLPASSDKISFSIKTPGFIWTKATMDKVRPTLSLTTGLHVLNVWMREDGQVFDKILLTLDPDFTPQNLGPAESQRRAEDEEDTVPPTGSVSINNGAPYALSRDVTLNLEGADEDSGVDAMRFSTDGGSTWTDWESFAATKALTLPAGSDGSREVRYQLRDLAGNDAIFADTIILDTVVPTGTIKINNNALETASRNVTLNLTGSDSRSGIDQMRFSTDKGVNWSNWENWASSKAFTLPQGDGFRGVDYQVRDRAGNVSIVYRDDIVLETGATPEAAPTVNPGGVFTLALDDTILGEIAADGLVGFSLAATDKFYDTFADLYDFLIFIPTLNGSRRISVEHTNSATQDNANGSFYLGAHNDILGIGDEIYNYRDFFGAPADGEFEGMVLLDSALSSSAQDRFSTSSFASAGNVAFFNNVLTQEIAHRYGSFLTSAANDPLGIIGRQLAHWDVFFDANFSPMDGNDWTDNGDGTFTLTKSYIDQVEFTRTNPMPYNDLDLYSMGLLEAGQVNPMFMVDNPRIVISGVEYPVRPSVNNPLNAKDAGPFVDIQVSGVWQGPYYLDNGSVFKGTRRNISLGDITALEGARNPAAAAAQKNFKVAFVAVTDETEDAADVTSFLAKLDGFQDQFLNFFKTQARNLGELVLPSLGFSGAASMGGAAGFGGSLLSHAQHEEYEEPEEHDHEDGDHGGGHHHGGDLTREEFIQAMNDHLGAEQKSFDLTGVQRLSAASFKAKDQNQLRRRAVAPLVTNAFDAPHHHSSKKKKKKSF